MKMWDREFWEGQEMLTHIIKQVNVNQNSGPPSSGLGPLLLTMLIMCHIDPSGWNSKLASCVNLL